MTAPRPLLVIGLGNPSRGDDALGPALVDALRAAEVPADGSMHVEWLVDFQLQVEHALDLAGRRAVLFIDAARPGHTGTPGGVRIHAIEPEATDHGWTSHALRPEALLGVYRRVQGRAPPPAWLLAIEGETFELGAPLSRAANARLAEARALAAAWLRAQQQPLHPAGMSGSTSCASSTSDSCQPR